MASKVSGVIEKINVGGTERAIASSAYGYCDTPASTPAKVVDMTDFKLYEGITIHVKFKERNSAASPTLNVQGTGAKPIVQYGTTAVNTTDETNGWYAGAVLTLTYDGTSWVRDQGFNTNTWRRVENSLTSDSTSVSLTAAQGKVLKGLIDAMDASTPAASGNATAFIDSITQTDGKITSITKKNIPTASTSTAGIIKIGTTANDAAAGNHNHDTLYIKNSDELLTTNPFAPASLKGPYISKIDNAFYAADKRWTVTANGINAAVLFDGNYESQAVIAAGNSVTILMDFDPNHNNSVYFPGYPYGYILISFYYTSGPASITGRVYCNYSSHGIGWHDISFSPVSDNGSSSIVYRSAHQGYFNISQLEITITAPSSNNTGITQIEMHLDRPSSARTPFLSKYNAETLYYDLTAPKFIGALQGNADTATKFNSTRKIELTGAVTGSATTDGSSGWTINTTVNHNHDSRYKIASGVITLGSNTITPITSIADLTGSTITAVNLRTNLGLSAALRFIGKATTDMSESTTTAPTVTGVTNYVPEVGDVVLDKNSDAEYVCIAKSDSTYTWELLGRSGSWATSDHKHGEITNGGLLGTASMAVVTDGSKKITTADLSVNDSNASTNATTTFVQAVTQNAQGKITVTKASLDTSGPWSGKATTAGTADKISNLVTADQASSSATWRRVWISYADNVTGRPAWTDNLVFQTSTNTLKTTKFQGALIGNADTATTATSSKVLANQNGTYGTATTTSNRVTNTNIAHVNNGGVTHFKVGTATNGPTGGGNILHFYWDTADAWDAQLHIPNNSVNSMSWRASSAAGTWNSWRTLLDTNNYTDYTVTQTGFGASGTWGISISGNATAAGTATSLANNPSIQASASNANQVTITAGEKTSEAYTIPYATKAGGIALTNGTLQSPNVDTQADTYKNKLTMIYCSDSMTQSPPSGNGYILSFGGWDNVNCGAQLYVGNTTDPRLEIRGASNNTWGLWKAVSFNGHTHTISLAEDNSASQDVFTLEYDKNYKLTVDNSDDPEFIFATPAPISTYLYAGADSATGHASRDEGEDIYLCLRENNAQQSVVRIHQGDNMAISSNANGVITFKASYSTVSKSAAGLCPQLPNETTTTKFLCQDGNWVVPSHHKAYLRAGAENGTDNGATTTGKTYLLLVENGEHRSGVKLIPGSNMSIISDASGNVTFTSSYIDTKNTAGSTNSTDKLFLIGAASQDGNYQETKSNQYVFEDDGELSAKTLGINAGTTASKVTLQWNNSALEFVFT